MELPGDVASYGGCACTGPVIKVEPGGGSTSQLAFDKLLDASCDVTVGIVVVIEVGPGDSTSTEEIASDHTVFRQVPLSFGM
jgi:hypothetical protein